MEEIVIQSASLQDQNFAWVDKTQKFHMSIEEQVVVIQVVRNLFLVSDGEEQQ